VRISSLTSSEDRAGVHIADQPEIGFGHHSKSLGSGESQGKLLDHGIDNVIVRGVRN
jgi:hypothetical protein